MTSGALLILLFCAGACYAQDKNVVELAVATPSLSTLVKAVTAADLAGALSGAGPFTVFAPTDDAFAALPDAADLLKPENKDALAGLLKLHVISGSYKAGDLKDSQDVDTLSGRKVNIVKRDGGVFVNGAKVTTADVIGSNGVVHIIDKVILPNVVQLAVGQPAVLSTLVEAVTKADLAGTLSGAGPFTVFAPTNAAFAALPDGTLANLLKPENKETLKGVLTFHVISGRIIKAGDLKDSQVVKTVSGLDITIVKRDGGVYVNGAKVVTADVTGWNGVVHVVDKVILPPDAAAAPAAAPAAALNPGKTSSNDSSSTRASALFAMASLLLLALARH